MTKGLLIDQEGEYPCFFITLPSKFNLPFETIRFDDHDDEKREEQT